MFKLNGQQFKQMLVSGANNLENYQNEINALNVFPVPDGDTGTNMSMTFTNGCKEAQACFSDNFSDVAKALQKGLLMGARGNSGVITSQIFRGFYQSVKGKEEVTAYEIADAFENGAKVAYKAIMKPVEGTILTVIRESAWYAKHDFEKNPKISVEEYFDNLLSYARESLNKTPELLQQLKDAGVVDSGGAGLCRIFEGFKAYMEGKPVEQADAVTAIHWDPSRQLLAYGRQNGSVVLRSDEQNMAYNRPIPASASRISALRLMGPHLVLSSFEGLLLHWEMGIDQSSSALDQVKGWIYCLDLSPDQKLLYYGDQQGGLHQVAYQPDVMAAEIHARLTRNFTPEEWEQYIGKGYPYEQTIIP